MNQLAWWQPHLNLFIRLSSWIVGPIIVGLMLGKWLEVKYGYEPWLFLGTVGLSFVISMVGLITNTLAEYKKIAEDEAKAKK
jgi:F0F1-type ATP synthase assembly protein I